MLKIIPETNYIVFKNIFKNIEVKKIKSIPGYIFYTKDNTIYFEYNIKTKNFWCDYKLIWSMFDDYDYDHTKSILTTYITDYFFIPLDVNIRCANLDYKAIFL